MATRRSFEDDLYAGLWEAFGRIVVRARSGKAVLFDDGVGKKWLPLSKVKLIESGDGSVTVFMPDWLYRKPYEKDDAAA